MVLMKKNLHPTRYILTLPMIVKGLPDGFSADFSFSKSNLTILTLKPNTRRQSPCTYVHNSMLTLSAFVSYNHVSYHPRRGFQRTTFSLFPTLSM